MEKDASHSINQETLDFIFEHTKNAPEAQLKDVESLDNKVIQLLSISSVIIGLVAFAISDEKMCIPTLISLGIALLAYIALVLSALIHLVGSPYRRSFQADKLWDMFWKDDIKDIKHSLVADISAAYAFNKEQIDKKRKTLLATIVCAAIEVVAVGVFIILAFL